MRKSELYARYDNFRSEIEEVESQVFYKELHLGEDRVVNSYVDGSTEVMEVKMDGVTYISYSSWWNVGWQGDIDSDQFFCIKKTISKAEIEELSKIFG